MNKKFFAMLLILLLAAASTAFVGCDEEKDEENIYLVLVNKENVVDANYVPDNLVDIDRKYVHSSKKETIQLEKTTLEALIKMLDGMKDAGITNVTVTSAYRTYEYQERLFNKYIENESNSHPTWSEDRVKEEVLTYSAAPGTSEHQTGLCVDLFTDEMEGLYNFGKETPKNPYDKGFAETEAYEWLCENAYKYGFILRFPENKTGITGYSYESWHYRYVGVEHATEIHEKGLTLEEYLDK